MAIARAFGLTTGLFTCVLPLLAQGRPDTATKSVQAPVGEPTVNLKFGGGTLTQFLAQLREKMLEETGGLNILAPALADDIELPRIELANAPLLDALQSVAQVAPQGFAVEAARSLGAGGSPVYTVRVRATGAPTNHAQAVLVRVFSIRMLTTSIPDAPPPLKAETVLSAIEAGGRVQQQPLEVSYHEPSGLVFVRGTIEQIELVGQILDNIARDRRETPRPKKDAEHAQPEKGDTEKADNGKSDSRKKDE